ncbi:cGMP-dependent 3',5'-cyclic phosphodiesterase [Eumeta japonica]|uniref:cGMP-dependent 3',5'-cyclic phosphodiesterase n=1 Tax=Eumeta variegata TaxID=151549 RepID=A0A4C1SBH6_EUMVA|nr:cGMP-dependent 3',5'-cyclic phosphodiesterase [Eumeta japonica]
MFTSEGSVVERHHLAQALAALGTEGCDVLEGLPRHDYDRALLMLRDYVLATDLANFYKNLCEHRAVAMDYQLGNPRHGAALVAVLMSAADLSDHIKNWSCAKRTAASVLMEFFHQNELEKQRGEQSPDAADRGRALIPDLQIDFIRNVCAPVFESVTIKLTWLLSKIIPRAKVYLNAFEQHLFRWENSKSIFAEASTLHNLYIDAYAAGRVTTNYVYTQSDIDNVQQYYKRVFCENIDNVERHECRSCYKKLKNLCLLVTTFFLLYDENLAYNKIQVPTLEGISVLVSPNLDNLIDFNIQEKERLRLLAIQEAEEAERAAREAALAAEEEEEEEY